jgi:hypothetical protein
MTDEMLIIRRATAVDAEALTRLAALDSAAAPGGDVLVAVVDGELWAAVEVDSGATIADPFRPSGELRPLLRLRARGMRPEPPTRGRLSRLLPRTA